MMIRHMVFLKFRVEFSDEQISLLMKQLDGLQEHLQGISDFQCHKNKSPEGDVVHGFTQMFWFDFETARDRDAYLCDPKHKAIGGKLVEACQGGTDGIFVCDIDL